VAGFASSVVFGTATGPLADSVRTKRPKIDSKSTAYLRFSHYFRLVGAELLSSFAFYTVFVGNLTRKFRRLESDLIYFLKNSSLTKLSSSFWVLLIGRLFGGISTSMLFSTFESW